MAVKETERFQTAAADLVEHGSSRRVLLVVGIMLAVLLILDTTIVNVALPTLQGNLGANFDDAAWIVTGYLIAVIIALPLVPGTSGPFVSQSSATSDDTTGEPV